MSVPVIELKNIHKRFPGVYALRDMSLTVNKGEVHALVGENGAGKSTLIKIISGAYRAEEGCYFIGGDEVEIQSPADAIQNGVGVVYQELNLAENMNIAENIFFGRLPQNQLGVVDFHYVNKEATKFLEIVGLSIDPRTKVGHLTIAKQQLVEIAKVLSFQPKLVIMDEPTSALSTTEINNLFQVIEKLRSQGVGIIYVSHKMDEIFRLSDRITVMRDGQHVKTLRTKDVTEDELIKLMVGRDVVNLYPRDYNEKGEVVLEVSGLTTDYVHEVSFLARSGEIVGFSGLMGSGRTELANALYGVDRKKSGTIKISGVPVDIRAPK